MKVFTNDVDSIMLLETVIGVMTLYNLSASKLSNSNIPKLSSWQTYPFIVSYGLHDEIFDNA
jgi:hypothetical protein